jgi:YD repeat-containing protein
MKNNSKLLLFTLLILTSLFSGKQTHASGTYSDEGIAFYAYNGGSSYASEGIAFYAYAAQLNNSVPIYRFYNTTNGDHFYTSVNSNHPGYLSEGISFYAFATETNGTIPIYRYYNPSTGDHFYTIINTTITNYNNEGIAFYAFTDLNIDNSPIYRFYNPKTGDHMYTASESEKNSISLTVIYRFYNPSNGDHFYSINEATPNGYYREGVAFYAYNIGISNSVQIYQYYNKNTGDHFYSTSNSTPGDYVSEGVAFYAFPTQISNSSPIYRFYNSTTGDHLYTASESERYALIVGPLGPEISVGLWGYDKKDIQPAPFQIDANKPYNIRDDAGNILAKVTANATTKVTYDANGNLKITNSIPDTLVPNSVTFDATDGNNTDIIFNTHRSNYLSDWRGKIDSYRGKIKAQYYHGTDLAGGTTTIVQQVWIINILPLEQYAWGSAETSGTGNINHTEVMSTIYRTYGFWYIKYANKYSAYGYKIRSDSGSQNYGGYDWEVSHPNIKIAAQNTRGVIATYANDVALTPYSSWSDGRTRSWQEKWGGTDYPWCKSVPDPYGKNVALSGGSHMVGLIGNGSVNMANSGWNWQDILKYYYTSISLPVNY